jgi:hypothetical protein
VNDESERMSKEAVVAYFEELTQHLPGGTAENKERNQSGQPVSGPKILTRDVPNTKHEC